jgi:hypothetical protein
VIPLALAGAGLACLIGAALALRAVGPGYHIARLLAATPSASLDEAIGLARGGGQHYVRVSGRIASDEEFPDEHDRPLVYRRKRLEMADGAGGWQVLAEEREAVPFGVEARTVFVEVDAAALEEGLIVLTREARGRAAELGPELPAGSDPEAQARLVVEQISAVEHATVAGMPTIVGGERVTLTAGAGRPLILTTVEVPAAMRLLARGHRPAVIGAALLLIVGVALWLAAVVALLTNG